MLRGDEKAVEEEGEEEKEDPVTETGVDISDIIERIFTSFSHFIYLLSASPFLPVTENKLEQFS